MNILSKNLISASIHLHRLSLCSVLIHSVSVSTRLMCPRSSVMSLIAGNDMLCLPGDIEGSIEKVK
jgi:hypothetical protein